MAQRRFPLLFRSVSHAPSPPNRLLVLGSGVAGCSTALTAARHGIPTTILHASHRHDCNSYWAQGGIIYRNYGESDTPESLVKDIQVASGFCGPLMREAVDEGLWRTDSSESVLGKRCQMSHVQWKEEAAWKLACEGPMRVRELLLGERDGGSAKEGVPFDRLRGELSLCLEASHSAPRILHHADCTGKLITTHIIQAAVNHPLIDFVGDAVVTDLIFDETSSSEEEGPLVIGVQVLHRGTSCPVNYYATHGVVLASGGLAGIYQHSTNPAGFNALGSSVALALRLQDKIYGKHNKSKNNSNRFNNSNHKLHSSIVSDLEYVQFHPTSLYLPNESRFLLTEALRGEGAVLRDADGRAFAQDYHPRGELAPRDIVARAVFCETQNKARNNSDHNAFLDITHRDSQWLKQRFPSINAHLFSRSIPIDFTREWMPIVPAAHYTCGGVTTNLYGNVVSSCGTRSYRNLYAAGEAARTGLHGGNRLASTSLLEGLVFGASVGECVAGIISAYTGGKCRESVLQDVQKAECAIDQYLVRNNSSLSRPNTDSSKGTITQSSLLSFSSPQEEAKAILTSLKEIMWDNVGVVRTPSKLAMAVSELTAIRDKADQLWVDSVNANCPGWEIVALRDAAYAGTGVAEAALANHVSGGSHYIISSEDKKLKQPLSEPMTVDGIDEDEEAVMVVRG